MSAESIKSQPIFNEHGHDVREILYYDENGNPVYQNTKYGLFGDQIRKPLEDNSAQFRWKPRITSDSK